jgi:hypothetical protein
MDLFLGTWDGERSQVSTTWLRWWDSSGDLSLWGHEKIEQERKRAEVAEAQLQQERVIRQRLADRLTALGIDIEK